MLILVASNVLEGKGELLEPFLLVFEICSFTYLNDVIHAKNNPLVGIFRRSRGDSRQSVVQIAAVAPTRRTERTSVFNLYTLPNEKHENSTG